MNTVNEMQPFSNPIPDKDQPSAELLDLARLVAQRLERLSADSLWARRASGARGTLLKSIARIEAALVSGESLPSGERMRLESLLEFCFDLLEKAAKELY